MREKVIFRYTKYEINDIIRLLLIKYMLKSIVI